MECLIYLRVRKHRYSPPYLAPQRIGSKCQNPFIYSNYLSYVLRSMNLKRSVLLHSTSVIRSNVTLRKHKSHITDKPRNEIHPLTPWLPIQSSSSDLSNANAQTPKRSPPSASTHCVCMYSLSMPTRPVLSGLATIASYPKKDGKP